MGKMSLDYNIPSPLEAVRELIERKGWYSSNKFNHVKDISFMGCYTYSNWSTKQHGKVNLVDAFNERI